MYLHTGITRTSDVIFPLLAGVERLFGQFTDPVSVSNVLKVYIFSLPESIFTVSLESTFILTAEGIHVLCVYVEGGNTLQQVEEM